METSTKKLLAFYLLRCVVLYCIYESFLLPYSLRRVHTTFEFEEEKRRYELKLKLTFTGGVGKDEGESCIVPCVLTDSLLQFIG